MALKRDTVEVPLYVGMGEGQDAQSRSGSAVVSENVRFDKKGAIRTRPAYAVKHSSLTGSYASVIGLKDRALIATTEQVLALDDTEDVRVLEGYSGAQQVDETFINPTNDSAAWVKSFRVDESLVTFWLSPSSDTFSLPSSNYLDLWAVVTSEDGEVQVPPQVLRNGVGMSYDAVQGSNDDICVVTTDLATQTHIDIYSFTGGVLGRDHTVTHTASSLFISPENIKRVAVTTDSSDWVIGIVTGYSGNTVGNDDRGQTGFLRYTSSLSFAASSVVDDGTLTSNHLGGGALLSLGTSPAGVIWVACGDYHDTRPYVYTMPSGSFTPSTPLALDGPYSWAVSYPAASPAENGFHNGLLGVRGNSLCSDATFAFNGESPFLCWHGVARMEAVIATLESAEPSPTASGISSDNRLFGTHVVYLTDVATVSSTFSFPQSTLGGDAWIENGECVVPLICEDSWSIRNDTPSVGLPLNTKYALPVEPIEDYASASSFFNTTVEARPAYAHAGLGRIATTGNARITTVFGVDEAVRHSEVAHDWVEPPVSPTPSPPYDNINYIQKVGGSVQLSNGNYVFVHPRRTVYQAAPYTGNGIISGKYRVGFGCFICITELGDPVQAGGADTADLPVLSVGAPALVDGDTIIAYTPPLPPQFHCQWTLSGTGATNYERDFAVCWAWVDSRGIRHRGPLSPTTSVQFSSWDIDADRAWISATPPPPIPGLLSERLILEVYANPVDNAGTVDSGSQVLVHTRSVLPTTLGAPFYIPVSMVPTEGVILPLVYTTGGVLPNEAAPVSGQVVQAKQRIWAFADTRVYYSKQAQYRDPGGFNANLYLDSPDGGTITGIASMDEQVICFTRQGIFAIRGNGPNSLGAGGTFTSQPILSPTGCVDRYSVVATERGVYFRGQRGIYLLQRNYSIQYLGQPEDSLPETPMKAAFLDRDAKEVTFLFEDTSFILDTRSGLWSKVDTPDSIDSGSWCAGIGPVLAGDGLVWSLNPVRAEAEDIYERDQFLPMRHSTPWLELSTKQGYQRCREFLIKGKATIGQRWTPADDTDPQNIIPGFYTTEPNQFLTAKIYVDDESEPAEVRQWDLRNFVLDPLELRLPNPRQKCRSVRIELSTEAANIDLTITSIVALIGRKQGAEKRQNSAGT